MKTFAFALLGFGASLAYAQSAPLAAPQISLTGNIGCAGFPCDNTGTLNLTADADHTMSGIETSGKYIVVTSSVSLTATRKLNYPLGRFPTNIENATTGGQALAVCGPTGACVNIPNNPNVFIAVWNDGAKEVQGGGSGSSTTTLPFTSITSGASAAGTSLQISGSSSLVPLGGSGAVLEANQLGDTSGSTPFTWSAGSAGQCLLLDGTATHIIFGTCPGGSSTFATLGGGTNTTATMKVNGSAILEPDGTNPGVLAANALGDSSGSTQIAYNATTAGMVLTANGTTQANFAKNAPNWQNVVGGTSSGVYAVGYTPIVGNGQIYPIHGSTGQQATVMANVFGDSLNYIYFTYTGTPSASQCMMTNTAANAIILGTCPGGSLTLTTTGTSGAATYSGGTLNIPQYSGATPGGATYSSQYNNNSSLGGGVSYPELKTTVGSISPANNLWFQALNNCQNQAVNVFYYTDSRGVVFQGDGSNEGPNVANNRYAEQMRLYLQNRCGSNGTGLVPFLKFLVSGSPNPNSQYWSASGTWAYDSTIGPSMTPSAGMSGTYGVLASASSGAVFTFTTSATNISYGTLESYCVTGPSYGSWAISVDSGATTGTCGGNSTSATAQLVSTTLGASTTNHVVTYTCGTGPCKIYGAQGINGTTGVSVSNMGEASGVAELYSTSTAFAFADLIPNGPNLVITDFGTNEPNLGYTTTTYQAALTTIITHEQALASKPAVLLFEPPVSNNANASQMPAYATAALATAMTNNVGYVSVIDQWSSTYISSLFGSDGIHPNDKGNLSEYSLQHSAVIDNEPTSALLAAANTFTGGTQTISVSGSAAALDLVESNVGILAGIEFDASPNTGTSGQQWLEWAQSTTGQNGLVFHSNANSGLGVMALNNTAAGQSKIVTGANGGLCWNSFADAGYATSGVDTCLWRGAAGVIRAGNATVGDASGTLSAATVTAGSVTASGVDVTVGASGSPLTHLSQVVGLQGAFEFNTHYNGSAWVYDQNGYASAIRLASAGTPATQGFQFSCGPSGSAGGTFSTMDTTAICQLSLPGNHTIFAPGTNTPTIGTAAILTVNPVNSVDNAATMQVSTTAVGNKGFVAQGFNGQTADLFEAQSYTGSILASINSSGAGSFSAISNTSHGTAGILVNAVTTGTENSVVMSGDCTFTTTSGAIVCTKTNGTTLGTMSTQNASAVAITGGTINGTTIGATTPSTIVGSALTDTALTTAGIATNTASGVLGSVVIVPVANGGTGLSTITAGQVMTGGSGGTSVTMKPTAGAGAGYVTGPTTSVTNDVTIFTGTGGQIADSGLLYTNVPSKATTNTFTAAQTATQFIASQGENVVTFSTTPVFLPTYLSNIITLTANLTSWTIAAGNSGQSMTLTFCQNATGGFTTGTVPSNVRGFTTIGTTASKCNSQSFTYSPNQTAWMAISAGAINQ